MPLEIALALLFAGTLVIGALLGLYSFFKVRSYSALPERIDLLEETVARLRADLRRALDDRPRLYPDAPAKTTPKADPGAVRRSEPPRRTTDTAGETPKTGDEDQTGKDKADAEKPAAAEPGKTGAPVENEKPRKTQTPPTGDETKQPASGPIPVAARDAAPKKDIENTIGALWAVWIGGLALALGGVFLVRYSIEQGWIGPTARVLIGLAFAGLLGAAGEWTRRRGKVFSIAGYERANVPAILTAAGTIAAFASVYAAYALYGLISPALCFVVLGIVAVVALFAALLHGLLLASVGLIGSYSVPFLITTDQPNALALALYILAVSGAAFGVARLRLWRWLAIVAAIGLVAWGVLLLLIGGPNDREIVFGYTFAALAMVFFVFVASLYRRDPATFLNTDRVATAALAGILFLLHGAVLFRPYDALTTLAMMATIVLCFGAAVFYPAARYVAVAALFVVVPGYLGWSVPLEDMMRYADDIGSQSALTTPMLEDLRRSSDRAFVWTGIVLAAVGLGIGLYGTLVSASRAVLAASGTSLALLLLSVAYLRMEQLQPSLLFGASALGLGLVFAAVANALFQRIASDAPARDAAIAGYLIAALAAIALALGIVLERGALTIALALLVPATAFVYTWRPLPALRPLAIVFALLWVARVAWDPRIVGADLGTVPILNWLTYGYGIPAAAFAWAAIQFGRDRRDVWLEALEGIAVATVTLALALVGLHAVDPAALFTPIDTLSEGAVAALVAGGVSLGLLRLSRSQSSRVLQAAATGLGYAGMAIGAFGLLVAYNPLLTGETIGGGLILNRLTFGYFAPALLYATLAWAAQTRRPHPYALVALCVSCVLGAVWITLSIRHAFHPLNLMTGPTTDAEVYVYSAVWLVIGILVLAVGLVTQIRPVRLLSGIILLAVVAKVFLIDMANLTGVLRALSFIGLGFVLIAIGLVYQRLLRKPVEPSEPDATETT